LNETVGALNELSKGHFDIQVAEDNSDTEIGRLNQTLVEFREKLKETEELRAPQIGAERQAEIDRRNAVVRFADEFDAAVGSSLEPCSPRSDGRPRLSLNFRRALKLPLRAASV
jgi:hypothetical protein